MSIHHNQRLNRDFFTFMGRLYEINFDIVKVYHQLYSGKPYNSSDFSYLKQEEYYTHSLWRLLSPTNISGVRQPILLFERSLKQQQQQKHNSETLVLHYSYTHSDNHIQPL